MPTNILMVGPTGAGKSTASRLISKVMGAENAAFAESAGVASFTHDVVDVTLNDHLRIIDNPGTLDSRGLEADRANMSKIVAHAKKLGHINAVVIVLNSQTSRFDDGILNGIKLIVDSFGPDILDHMGFLFTRASTVSAEELKTRVVESSALIDERCEFSGNHFERHGPSKFPFFRTHGPFGFSSQSSASHFSYPFWSVDCHPENLAAVGSPPEKIEEVRGKSEQQIRALIGWAEQRDPYSTINAVVGEYKHVMERLKAEAKLEAERGLVCVKNEIEERVIVLEKERFMKKQKQSVLGIRIWDGAGSWYRSKKRREMRPVQILRNGMREYGAWTQVGEEWWEDA